MLDSTVWPDHLMNNYGTPPITIDHGEGCYLIDSEGRRHIDMLAGIAVNALGYGHPAIVDAVSAQLARGSHVSNLFASEPPLALASKLREIVGEDSSRVFFCNSGTEANEAAFKLARLTGRPTILAAEHGFHGRTMGSLALTGQPAKQAPFAPLPGGVEYYPYGDIDALRQRADLDQVAAIFLEPIQGETGVIPAPDGFLKAVRELCDEHGILMVCDLKCRLAWGAPEHSLPTSTNAASFPISSPWPKVWAVDYPSVQSSPGEQQPNYSPPASMAQHSAETLPSAPQHLRSLTWSARQSSWNPFATKNNTYALRWKPSTASTTCAAVDSC